MTDPTKPDPAEPAKPNEPARTYPDSDAWPPADGADKEVEIKHPLWRKAREIAIGCGIIAGIGIAIGHPDAPWWMPILTFAVVAAVVYRILRPRLRHPSIEDEI